MVKNQAYRIEGSSGKWAAAGGEKPCGTMDTMMKILDFKFRVF
jgi:hypothetical protein